jgi:hypothetical protein
MLQFQPQTHGISQRNSSLIKDSCWNFQLVLGKNQLANQNKNIKMCDMEFSKIRLLNQNKNVRTRSEPE